jgi:hypothetical protein
LISIGRRLGWCCAGCGRAIPPPTTWARQTIETVLVLSGLRTRGLADRVLVIVPAGLAEQPREELERKFVLPTAMAGNAEPDVAAIIRW